MFRKKPGYTPLEGYTVEDLLPHREPFLFCDRILEASTRRVVAECSFPPDTWFFKGHFPDYPIVPGVILVETLAQCGGAGLVAAGVLPQGDRFYLASVHNAKFRRPVRPGELLRVEVDIKKSTPRLTKQSGRILVGDELAVEAEWVCMVKE
ncbi:MAG: 3-hydroxyacyl-ACP dehydratase FabZ [Kiritimatiellaeota bacterium]|nr:3-hydroxyacyl-ACP dehydratase FabZ [Kiritimatiellota bacterium]